MKQEITQKQFMELNKVQSDEIIGWLSNKGYYDTGEIHLTIGLMIEFLDEWSFAFGHTSEGWMLSKGQSYLIDKPIKELADALWLAVKKELNG